MRQRTEKGQSKQGQRRGGGGKRGGRELEKMLLHKPAGRMVRAGLEKALGTRGAWELGDLEPVAAVGCSDALGLWALCTLA